MRAAPRLRPLDVPGDQRPASQRFSLLVRARLASRTGREPISIFLVPMQVCAVQGLSTARPLGVASAYRSMSDASCSPRRALDSPCASAS